MGDIERVGGALTAGVIDFALEHVWYSEGQPHEFPFTEVHPKIGMWDDAIAGGIVPGVITVAGLVTENESITDFGIGGFLYGGAMLVKNMLLRNVTFR